MSETQDTRESRTAALLAEIARPGSTRESIAAVYRDGIVACERGRYPDFVDWPTVNGALLKRYRASGLTYIKERAWKHAMRLRRDRACEALREAQP